MSLFSGVTVYRKGFLLKINVFNLAVKCLMENHGECYSKHEYTLALFFFCLG